MKTALLISQNSIVRIPLMGPKKISHLTIIQQQEIVLMVNSIVPVGTSNIAFEEQYDLVHIIIQSNGSLDVEHIAHHLINANLDHFSKKIKDKAEGAIHEIGHAQVIHPPSDVHVPPKATAKPKPHLMTAPAPMMMAPAPLMTTSAPMPTTVSASAISNFKYTILAGDSFNKIAIGIQACKGLSVESLTTANPDINPAGLSIGQVINIPNATDGTSALKYTILSGDYFSLIVDNINQAVGITAANIQSANPGVQPASLQIGQVINLPFFKPTVNAPITVKTSDGQEITWQLDINHTTLSQLKDKIQEQFKIPSALQSIGSSTLAPFEGDDKNLSEFQIESSGASLGVLSHGLPEGSGELAEDYKVVLYYPSWGIYARQYFLPSIDFSMVTHLNYAFANLKTDGTVFMPDPNGDAANFKSLKDIKVKYPKLKTMLSIGGWSYSSNFSAVAASATKRAKFVSSAISIMKANGFDGLDIDWEFPGEGGDNIPHSPDDHINFTLLLQDLRNGLGSTGLLTITVPPRPSYHKNFELGKIKDIVNWVSLMSYDYHGQWQDAEDSVTNFNAPIYEASNDPNEASVKHDLNIDASVRSLVSLGLPSKQLVLGLSFYGRGYTGVEPGPENNGLYQKWSSVPGGSWGDGSGVYDWWDISDNFLGKSDWQQYYHSQAQAAWIYSPSRKMLVAYDDPRTIWSKCAYVVSHQLGGTMAWDASSDRYNQLLYVANNALREGGIEATGGPVPKSETPAAGAAWSDKDAANDHSAPITAIDFCFNENGITGLRTTYDTYVSPWRGAHDGTRSRLNITPDRYITQFDIFTSPEGPPFKGIKITFDNGTSFSIGMADGVIPQYSIGACGSFLFYMEGMATDDLLTELSFEFRSIPNKPLEEFYPLENVPKDSIANQVAEASPYYLNTYTGVVSSDAIKDMSHTAAYYDSPHLSFYTGAADCHYTVLTDGGIGYSMGLQYQFARSVLKIGNPDHPTILIDYQGPALTIGLTEEFVFKNGQAEVIVGSALAGVDLGVGKNGFKLDSSFGDVGEVFEIDKDHIKVGVTEGLFSEGMEINKNGFGLYFGIGGLTIHVTVLNIKVLKSLEEDYIELGKYLWQMAPVVFKAIASAFVKATKAIADFFKSLFHL